MLRAKSIAPAVGISEAVRVYSLTGRIIVALPLGRAHILPEAIAQLTALNPLVQIATKESPFEILASDLRAGDIDFIFGALRPSKISCDLARAPAERRSGGTCG